MMISEIALTLLCLGTGNFALGDADGEDPCVEIFRPEYFDEMCCESLESMGRYEDDIKECNKKAATSEEWTCEDFECFLKQKGLIEDGKIIDSKVVEFLDDISKEFPKEKHIVDHVKNACLKGAFEQYPPEDGCAALKFHVCFYTNIMMECDSWKDSKVCKKASDLAMKCKGSL